MGGAEDTLVGIWGARGILVGIRGPRIPHWVRIWVFEDTPHVSWDEHAYVMAMGMPCPPISQSIWRKVMYALHWRWKIGMKCTNSCTFRKKETLSQHAVIRLCRDKGTEHVANHQPPGNFIKQHCFKRIVCRFASISSSAPVSWLTNSFFSQLLLKSSIVMLPSILKSISFPAHLSPDFSDFPKRK